MMSSEDASTAGLRNDIAQLEERIEALRQSIERCRKLSVAAKIAVAAGGALLVLSFLPWLSLGASGFFGGIAAMLGGAVLAGSNATTWTQTEAALAETERLRAQFIGSIGLRLVGDDYKTLH